jgi:hypothetical protein
MAIFNSYVSLPEGKPKLKDRDTSTGNAVLLCPKKWFENTISTSPPNLRCVYGFQIQRISQFLFKKT